MEASVATGKPTGIVKIDGSVLDKKNERMDND